jgi:hypothetical protein
MTDTVSRPPATTASSATLRRGQFWRPKGAQRIAMLLGEGPVGILLMRWFLDDECLSAQPSGAHFTLGATALHTDWEIVPAPPPISVRQVWRRKEDGLEARVMKSEGDLIEMATPVLGGKYPQMFGVPAGHLCTEWEFVGFGAIKVMSQPTVRSGEAVVPRTSELPVQMAPDTRKHAHYFRSVAHLNEIDIYRVFELFGVTDPCQQHAIKKLIVPGMRGGGKSTRKDIEEAIDTLQRKLEMLDEDAHAAG